MIKELDSSLFRCRDHQRMSHFQPPAWPATPVKVTFCLVVMFNMDEYVDLEQTHPESHHSFMHIPFNEPSGNAGTGHAPSQRTLLWQRHVVGSHDGSHRRCPDDHGRQGSDHHRDGGAQKAHAVRNAIEGGVSQMCTLSCLQFHPCGIVVVDKDAALELKYGIVKVRGIVEGKEAPHRLTSPWNSISRVLGTLTRISHAPSRARLKRLRSVS